MCETAALSKNVDVCEAQLRFFVEQKLPECFAACLVTAYDFIRPDVALEVAWTAGWTDMVMPFLIQTLREYIPKIKELDERTQVKEEAPQVGAAVVVGPAPPGSVMMPPGSVMMPPGTGMMPPPPMSMAAPMMGGMQSMQGPPQPYMSAPSQGMPMQGGGSAPGYGGYQ